MWIECRTTPDENGPLVLVASEEVSLLIHHAPGITRVVTRGAISWAYYAAGDPHQIAGRYWPDK